jgi:hypothetical protein
VTVLLLLLPAAALFAVLLLGRYPGEDVLDTARRLRRGLVKPSAAALLVPSLVPIRRPPGGLPRGGRLVAAAIAARPPPLAAVVRTY